MNIRLKLLLIISAVVAFLVPPALVVYIALSHNPDGEFMDEAGHFNWEILAYLVAPSLLVGIVLSGLIVGLLLLVIKVRKRNKAS